MAWLNATVINDVNVIGERWQFAMMRRIIPSPSQCLPARIHPLVPVFKCSDSVQLNHKELGNLKEIAVRQIQLRAKEATLPRRTFMDNGDMRDVRIAGKGRLERVEIGLRIHQIVMDFSNLRRSRVVTHI